MDRDEITSQEKDAEKDQKRDNGIFAQTYVTEKGAEYWKQASRYGLGKSLLSPVEMSIIGIACEIPQKIPTEKQSEIVIRIEKN
ncbi:MAG: hypothetical protein ABGX83_09560 [Nitrospira sp.]|nr:hypothetical protein [Candidatus Manganitrophaceae bacterium]HIL35721.1 hypothetical protein [Candidatus Manganitrophaceae bacterium]